MELQEVLELHANGGYDYLFENYWDTGYCMTGYVAHSTDVVGNLPKHSFIQGACHAPVNTAINRQTALAVITMADRKLADNPGAIQYYDWLINKSFFADVFLCKDPVKSLRHGFVKKIDVSAAKWLGAAQLARLSTSEFKVYMHAVYDILASGFDIHPALLTVLATELKLVSDKKTIKATNTRRVTEITNAFYCANSSHLPFVYLETIAALKDMCKDDPNKLIEQKYQQTFRETRWQNASNYVASNLMSNYSGSNDKVLREAFSSLTKGNPSILFGLDQAMMEVPYTFLWEDAVRELKEKVVTTVNGVKTTGGIGINLSSIELLSKQYKLGE